MMSGHPKQQQNGKSQDNQQKTKQPQLQTVEQLLLENEELLAEVKMESKYRKNKNNVSVRMCLLINRIERNLIKIGKQTPPEVLADPQHVIKEKERFLRFYQKRNSKKPVLAASKVKDRNSEHI